MDNEVDNKVIKHNMKIINNKHMKIIIYKITNIK